MDSKLERQLLDFIFSSNLDRRFTQDTPILPDVWLAYADIGENTNIPEPQDILIQPWFDQQPGDVVRAWQGQLGDWWADVREKCQVAFNQSNIVARLDFLDMLALVLPQTRFGADMIERYAPDRVPEQFVEGVLSRFTEQVSDNESAPQLDDLIVHFGVLVGIVAELRTGDEERVGRVSTFFKNLSEMRRRSPDEVNGAIAEGMLPVRAFLMTGIKTLMAAFERFGLLHESIKQKSLIWSVNLNRPATLSLHASRRVVKADAAEHVFNHDTSRITWAVLDSGIDAHHPAFVNWREHLKYGELEIESGKLSPTHSRVVATYDFVRFREILSSRKLPDDIKENRPELNKLFGELEHRVNSGRAIDWDLIKPLIEIRHDNTYRAPQSSHGTHVAGILGAGWRDSPFYPPKSVMDTKGVLGKPSLPDHQMLGICPDIRLIDVRVFDDRGQGDEFSIIAALQFLAHLNRNRDVKVVHGVNLSLSLKHNVSNFACGQTPICIECQNLTGDGMVVVAAAGNAGHQTYHTDQGMLDGYNPISITDPGNADCVITVGATHRERPHTYGVSYFSSRGPTGDGRAKPDLVAPGEKIFAPIPGCDAKYMDGTSMAAPHVSGAAAILMARHEELIGQPGRIKEVLCGTATDLGRERYFQGAGLLDILRALESI